MHRTASRPIHRNLVSRACLLTGAVVLCSAGAARADIFVGSANDFSGTTGTIGEYRFDGSTVNASLVSGIGAPFGVAATTTDVYYTDNDTGLVGDYNLATGTLNPSFISGIGGATGILVSGSTLYIGSQAAGTVATYTTGGTLLNPDFITGLNGQRQMVISDGDLYVNNLVSTPDPTNPNNPPTVTEYVNVYNAVTGSPIATPLVSGVKGVAGLAVSSDGQTVYVSDQNDGTIGSYNASTGAAIDSTLISIDSPQNLGVVGTDLYAVSFGGSVNEYDTSGNSVAVPLISGLSNPIALAIVVPEPSATTLLACVGLAGLLALRRRSGTAICR